MPIHQTKTIRQTNLSHLIEAKVKVMVEAKFLFLRLHLNLVAVWGLAYYFVSHYS